MRAREKRYRLRPQISWLQISCISSHLDLVRTSEVGNYDFLHTIVAADGLRDGLFILHDSLNALSRH